MNKKTILNEATIRRFLKLADLAPIAETYFPPQPTPELTEEEDLEIEDELEDELEVEDEPLEAPLEDVEADADLAEDVVTDLVQHIADWAEGQGVDMAIAADEEDLGDDLGDDLEDDLEDAVDTDLDLEDEEEDLGLGNRDLYEDDDIEEKKDPNWGGNKGDYKRRKDAAGVRKKRGDVGHHYKDYMEENVEEGDLEEDKPFTAKKEKPGEDLRKGAEKRGAEGTRKKTSGSGRGEKKGDDAYVNEEQDAFFAAVMEKIQAKVSEGQRDQLAEELSERIFKRLKESNESPSK